MRTNLSGIMLMISDYTSKINLLETSIKNHIYNTSIQELSGTITMLEDVNNDFKEELKEYQDYLKKITLLKEILYQKNHEFTLSDGSSIQDAIVRNANDRKLKDLYEYLIGFKDSKSRETEVNNSYFLCKSINYDGAKIKKEIAKLEKKIQNTDFEISKLNSMEFEIDL